MVPLVEALNTSSGVNELLGASEERVACRADLDMEVLRRRLCLDHIAARAMDFLKSVLRVDILLHFLLPPVL